MCVFVLQSRVRLPQETDCPEDMVMLDQNSDTNRVMGVEAKVRTEQEAQGDSPFTVRTLQHTLRAPVAVASSKQVYQHRHSKHIIITAVAWQHRARTQVYICNLEQTLGQANHAQRLIRTRNEE